MKEYLVRRKYTRDTYELVEVEPVNGKYIGPYGAIQVPEGANFAVMSNNNDVIFYKDKTSDEFFNWKYAAWRFFGRGIDGRKILWQRETPKTKEFLNPLTTGGYVLTKGEPLSANAIEVPEGADFYATGPIITCFYKNNEGTLNFFSTIGEWFVSDLRMHNLTVLWQRHTHPEELPFIDDEPKFIAFPSIGQRDEFIAKHIAPQIDDILNKKRSAIRATDGVCFSELPAHFVVRPKPRVRAYATLVHKIDIDVSIKPEPQYISLGFVIDADAISKEIKKAAKVLAKATRELNEALKLNRLG